MWPELPKSIILNIKGSGWFQKLHFITCNSDRSTVIVEPKLVLFLEISLKKGEIITSICHFHRSWCQFWKFLQPNCPLLSYLPSYWRHLCKTFFLLLSLFGGARKSIGSPSGESFCPNQSHSSSWIRKTLHHPFSQTYQCHIKLRGRLWSWRFNFLYLSIPFCSAFCISVSWQSHTSHIHLGEDISHTKTAASSQN